MNPLEKTDHKAEDITNWLKNFPICLMSYERQCWSDFHTKSKGAQGLVFMQITFEKGMTDFNFKNGEVDTIANGNYKFVTLISMKRFRF